MKVVGPRVLLGSRRLNADDDGELVAAVRFDGAVLFREGHECLIRSEEVIQCHLALANLPHDAVGPLEFGLIELQGTF